ncbi:hypothetical protein [Streptomyces uncialis]|uniref:hypothetical protein n=1 Tax=Streptomyces uncialis TaxID=1048205 RepID=UPI00093931CF|nr:hypothetical protein [Streptomyces uncialis]
MSGTTDPGHPPTAPDPRPPAAGQAPPTTATPGDGIPDGAEQQAPAVEDPAPPGPRTGGTQPSGTRPRDTGTVPSQAGPPPDGTAPETPGPAPNDPLPESPVTAPTAPRAADAGLAPGPEPTPDPAPEAPGPGPAPGHRTAPDPAPNDPPPNDPAPESPVAAHTAPRAAVPATGPTAPRRPTGQALWWWSSGRRPSPDPAPAPRTGSRATTVSVSTSTRRFLLTRMLLLPAVALTVLGLAATSYFTLHDRTEQLRERYAPALVELTHARVSLTLARAEAERRLAANDGEPLPQTDLVGLGERYPSLITEASQSLNNAALTGALHRSQEQEVRVVSGLVVAYDDFINWANSRHHSNTGLRRAGLETAAGLLGDGRGAPDSTAVLDRIRTLEAELRADARELSGWGGPAAGAASAAVLAALFLVFLLVGTLDFVHRRLRVRGVVLTLLATPVLLVLVVLAFGAAGQHTAQAYVGRTVDRLAAIEVERVAGGGIGEEIERETRTGAAIEDEGTRLAAHLRHTHPQERTLMAVLALALGTAGTLACGFTLFHYNRRHLEIHWRTA